MIDKVAKANSRVLGETGLGESPIAKPANHDPSANSASPDSDPDPDPDPDPVTE